MSASAKTSPTRIFKSRAEAFYRQPKQGDVQLSLEQLVPVQGAVLVTTPQSVSIADVRRALKMFE